MTLLSKALFLALCAPVYDPSASLPLSGAAQVPPSYVRVETQHWSGVFKVVPGQAWTPNVRDYKVFEFYAQAGEPLDLQAAARRVAVYANDWGLVDVRDVSTIVPAKGWGWNDANKAREDKLSVALVNPDGGTVRDRTIEGYGALDWGGGGAVVGGSDGLYDSLTFRENAAAGLYLKGSGNVVRNCWFERNLLKTSDQGQLYQFGRGKGGRLLVENCTFVDDPARYPVVQAWDKKTYWRRWGMHLDDESSDVVIRNCVFVGLDGAVLVNQGTNVSIESCTFKNCRLELEVVGTGKVTIVNSKFDGKPVPNRTRISGRPSIVTQ